MRATISKFQVSDVWESCSRQVISLDIFTIITACIIIATIARFPLSRIILNHFLFYVHIKFLCEFEIHDDISYKSTPRTNDNHYTLYSRHAGFIFLFCLFVILRARVLIKKLGLLDQIWLMSKPSYMAYSCDIVRIINL